MQEEERRQMITRERERWSEEERNILTEKYTELVPSILLSLREDLFGLDRIQGGYIWTDYSQIQYTITFFLCCDR